MDLRTPPPTLDGPTRARPRAIEAGAATVPDDVPSTAPAAGNDLDRYGPRAPLGATRRLADSGERGSAEDGTGPAGLKKDAKLRPKRAGGATAAGPPELAADGTTLARRRLRVAAVILFAMFAGFMVRHFVLASEGVTALTDAGWQRYTLAGVLLAIVVYLFSPLAVSRRMLTACEAVAFGGSVLFLLWVHRNGLLTAPPEAVPRLAAAYPGVSTVPWVLLIEIYALFLSHAAGRASVVIVLMAVAPLASAVYTARDSPELWAVLFERGMFSAMGVWMTAAAAAAVYGAFRLSSLRRAAAAARDLGSYRLAEKLGGGGMGEVYAAEHRLLRRPCAVKVIRPELAGDDHALARFDGEVRAAACDKNRA